MSQRDPFKEFIEYTEKEEDEVRLLNEVPTFKLCRIFLPKMVDRRKGAIINVSSAISKYPPFLYCYGR
jgi:short-subunit dehydrogenase